MALELPRWAPPLADPTNAARLPGSIAVTRDVLEHITGELPTGTIGATKHNQRSRYREKHWSRPGAA